ncbi:MAG TPA: PAS domain S-box protein, partial [Trebonia sp.]|nr:PAS domain S-box protein [Trebonia sp.]
MDTPELSTRELDALFDQSPVAMIFTDVEMRTRRANAAFRQLTGLSQEAMIGRRPTEFPKHMVDAHFVERILSERVIGQGVPVVNLALEGSQAGERRVLAWTAYRVTDNGRVIGAVGTIIDITGPAQAETDLRQANGRLDLLQRASSQIGTTLDVHRTATELATLAVPGLADRVAVDLLDPVLLEAGAASADRQDLRFRRFALLDSTTPGSGNFTVDELFIVPITRQPAGVFLRGELLVAQTPAEMGQLDLPSHIVQPLLDRGVHTLITVPLTARGVTLGVATFSRSKTREPYEEADVRLVCDLTARAAVHIDNARLYTREHESAVTLQRSLLPRDIPPVAGLDIAYRYQPASQGAEIGGDWFDVIPLPDGDATLVVGDVTGHGIHAAAIMGQLRTTGAALTR